MKICLFSVLMALVVARVVPSDAATLELTDKGVKIESTGQGASTLQYPTLLKTSNVIIKPIETTINGKNVTLKYDGGGQIVLDVSSTSQIVLKFSNIPADIKAYQTMMIVGFGVGPNRKWKFGDKAGEFPVDKPAKPHIFQGSAKTFTVTNYEGRNITLTVPDYTYQELTDNREWGWNVVSWKLTIPYNKDWPQATMKVEEDAAEIKQVILVDKFGQSTQSEWPSKVKSEAELKADVASENAYYASLKTPTLDKFGGLPESGKKLGLKATGFFHMEQKNGKWLLVDPEGNAFFHLGVCVFGPGDDFTTVKGREGIYEWLPNTQGEFKTALRPESGSGVVSFHLANQIRKYGEAYSPDTYTARMIERTKRFGFNSMGAFSALAANPAAKANNFPAVASLPLGEWDAKILAIPGTHGVFDPFDEGNRQKVEQSFASRLPSRVNDPLLIGYFLANEPLYEDIPKVVPSLKGTFAAKRRLVEMLREKYKTIVAYNTAWGASASNFEELNDSGLAVKTKAAAEDVQAFTGMFLDSYFALVTNTFRKYDKNHLLIGNRLQSGTINNEQLCRIMGKYLDVVSFNYYTYAFDKEFLTRIYNWTGGKPMMLTEFYWSSPKDSGMSSRQDVASQQERGLAYRNYVEQAAATGFIVGIEWFTLVDQATTGRWFSGFNGEAANTGLFSVTDRPWKPALERMSQTNFGIYDIWLNGKKPFVFNDPRFTQAVGGQKTVPISRATGPIKIDGTAQNWPGVPAEVVSSQRLVQGNSAEGLEGSFKMCWDETNLYLLANVRDTTPMHNTQSDSRLWNGDGLELFIGSEKLDEGGALFFTDRQILIGAGKGGQIYFGNAPTQVVAETVVVPGVDGKSYTIEAAIPWSALAIKPTDNMELKFDLAIDDSEGKERVRQLVWNGTAKNSADRTHWGRAKLVR